MAHPAWPSEVRAGSKCAAEIGDPSAPVLMQYEPDEQFDVSEASPTDMQPLQALAEQRIGGDVGSARRRWSFTDHLIIAGLIAMLVILALISYRY
jgi:hypothetical protein